MSMEQKVFGIMPNNQKINSYTLKNHSGARVECMEYGARITGIWVPNKRGMLENIVLAHNILEEYFGNDFLGATIGRYANRIGGGTFQIGGKCFSCSKNENGNTLHGGFEGFHKKVWRMVHLDDTPSITFALHSTDGEEGFPGNLDVTVRYTFSDDNTLIIEYGATTDAPTVLNLTNHSFFNLTGNAKNDILTHELQIEADFYTEVDARLVPTGKLLPTAGSPVDFRKAKSIGQEINTADVLVQSCGGFDHNFALRGNGLRHAAEVFDAISGRKMCVFTDMPGVQLYTANSFAEHTYGQDHIKLEKHHAFCLETQFFPDAPNHKNFASPVLLPDEEYRHTTTYKFELT